MGVNELLALTNAVLTAASAAAIAFGYVAVRRGNVRRHKRLMFSAVGLQAAFLCTFVARYVLYGAAPLPRSGTLQRYLTEGLLIAHEACAVVVIPLVLVTTVLGLMGRVMEHRQVARATLPLWGFVTVSGIVVYTMLYL